MELTVLRHAWTGLRAIFVQAPAGAATYAGKNMIGMLGLVLLIGALTEIPLHHLLLAREPWWAAAMLDALVLYASVWALGLYGVMASTPHRLDTEQLVFYRGPLARVHIERSDVVDARLVRPGPKRALRKEYGAGYLGVPGCDAVCLELRKPVGVQLTYPFSRTCTATKILVATDNARDLCALFAAR